MSGNANTHQESIENDLGRLRSENERLRNESARYRTERNASLRREHAVGTVLKAHNISFDVGQADLGSLSINNGKVEGEFDYTPTKAENRQAPEEVSTKEEKLTLDTVRAWSPDKINAEWEQVSKLLEEAA